MCKTKGTTYFFDAFDTNSKGVYEQRIMIAACLPKDIQVNEAQMIEIEQSLHTAFETILAPLFQ